MRRSKRARRPRGNVKTDSFVLKGGLNLVDAPIELPPGTCLAAVNYELLTKNGYRSIDGIERRDGQASPSEASYWIVNFDAGTGVEPSVDDIVTGLTNSYTSKILSIWLTSGSWGVDAAGYLVVTNATGLYEDDEVLQVSAATIALADGASVKRGALTPALDATFIQDAIETQRALIKKIGDADGSGPARGVHMYQGESYGFRDNAAGTECLMWKETASGFVQQALGNRVHFTLGTAEVLEAETLTQTGTTATINRVVVQSGDWATNDAAGYLIIGTVTSGPYAAGIATSPSGSLTLDAAEIANTLPPGGRYEFEEDNFFGTSQSKRLYGVNGVGPAFEWDGTVFTPIFTGNVSDTPSHLAINEFHLMLAFANGSLQNSATGTPYVWSGGGAAEIGVGHDIVGLKREVGKALIILCDDHTFALKGRNTVAQPWELDVVTDESGGIEWTMQRISGQTRYLEDQGFMSIRAAQEFGDFASATYSQEIEPLVTEKKTLAVSSVISRKKTQLRTFFSDGTGIIATFKDRKLAGFTTVSYRKTNGDAVPVLVTANGQSSDGSEVLLFGSSDGFMYEMDKGTSMDGDPIISNLTLSYHHQGSPSYDKQYKKVVIEAEGAVGVQLKYNAIFDYSTGRSPVGITQEETITSGGARWNAVFWNRFNWAAADVALIEGDLDGVGRNIGLQVSSISTYAGAHTLSSATYHYILRKLVR